jgi:hypothetical protein
MADQKLNHFQRILSATQGYCILNLVIIVTKGKPNIQQQSRTATPALAQHILHTYNICYSHVMQEKEF